MGGCGPCGEGAGSATVTVSLSSASGKTITVNYATSNGTATAGSDYTARSGSLTFTPGQTSKTVSVTIASDTVNESDETFTFTLSNASNATFADSSATVTIEDNPTLTVGDVTVNENNDATLTVSLDVIGAANVTVNYATSDGTAVAGSDYTSRSGTLTVNAGATSGTVTVPINDDPTDEHDETFTFTLSGVANASITDLLATVTIADNDPPPTMSVGDVTVLEGAGSATVTVSLSLASGKTITVNYATSDGTATAGSDYTARSGSLTFVPGDTSKTVSVPIASDTVNESDETFTFTLSNASNATFADSSATVTIEDNPTLTVADVTVNENNNATLTVSLDVIGAANVTVNYATSDGTAVAGSDYTSRSGTLTVNAGATSGTVTVPINDDPTDEHDETFTFTLSGVANASISDGSATVTIVDNDPPPTMSVGDVTVAEDVAAGSVGVTVSLSLASGKTITVDYATSDGTAVAGSDYTAASGTLTFMPGDTSKTVSVPIDDDPTDEHDETFTFTLSNASNATFADSSATVTITDDDPPPTMSVGNVTIAEAAGSATLRVSLSLASGKTITVDYATSDGTAVAPGDYTAASGSLTFVPGDTVKTVPVTIISDIDDEDAETFTFTLSSASNATFADSSATVTIGDNPTLTVENVEIDERAGNAVFTVSLDAAGEFALTVDYATADSAAEAPVTTRRHRER